MKRTAFILLLLALATTAGAGEILHLKAACTAGGTEIRLADALEEGEAAPYAERRLASSPRPGAVKTVSRARVQRLLWDWGWRGRLQGAESLRMETPSMELSAEALHGPVMDRLDALLGEDGLRRRDELRGWPEKLSAASSRLEWELQLQGDADFRERSARLVLRDELGFEQSLTLRFRCEKPATVAVAETRLEAGEELKGWRLEERDLLGLEGRPLDESSLKGAVARRLVPEGAVLTDRLLATELMVRAGREVSIEVIKGAVRVSLAGIAQDDAGLGETVAVRHRDSRLLRRYRVAGPGRVVPVWANEGELDS